MRYIYLAAVILAPSLFGQGAPEPLMITRVSNITSTPSVCTGNNSQCVDNRSSQKRNDYHSMSCSGSGTWSAGLEYSTSGTGSWTSFGSAAILTQASNPSIAYGIGYFPFIRVNITGTVACEYSASKKYFLSSSAGAVNFPISWIDKIGNKPFIDVREYGAVGDGATDDAAAIRAAIAAASPGETVVIPSTPNGFLLTANATSGSNKYLINIGKNITLKCDGRLKMSASVASDVDGILIRNLSGSLVGATIDGCGITPVSGTPGRYGIHVDATSTFNGSNYITNLKVKNLGTLGPFGSTGIKFTFPTYTDGIFNSEFTQLGYIYNGINCDNCGDSLTFEGGTLLGDGPGFRFKQLFGAGNMRFSKFSIITCAPAIQIINGEGSTIERNVVEAHPTGGFGLTSSCVQADAQIDIGGTSVGVVVSNNTIVNLPANASQIAPNKYSIKIGASTTGTIVHGNTHGLGNFYDYPNVNPQKALWVVAGATDFMVFGDYMKYATDWSLYAVNNSNGNGYIMTHHNNALRIDSAVIMRPNGYDGWTFKGNYVGIPNGAAYSFAQLASENLCTDGLFKIFICFDCTAGTPCTGGGGPSIVETFGSGSCGCRPAGP
jgi:hypothetical protein